MRKSLRTSLSGYCSIPQNPQKSIECRAFLAVRREQQAVGEVREAARERLSFPRAARTLDAPEQGVYNETNKQSLAKVSEPSPG